MWRYPSISKNLVCLIKLGLAIVLLSVMASPSQADMLANVRQLLDPPNQTPHPAVVQVFVRESDAIASGSGTLIRVDAEYGYVLTNWHVVRSAKEQQLLVIFPDGFQSAATVLRMDETWDLALLRIWRPHVAPMPFSGTVPVVGEELVIAGYGQDKYRAARGQCCYYAAPDSHSPQDMIEVSVAARQGDSGGPIINQRGELAAVLFGSGRGMTTGTHIGRIVSFLNSASDEPASTQLVARVANTDKTQRASFITSGSDKVNNDRPSENELAAATKPSQYYKLPPLEWTSPGDDSPITNDSAADNVPVFPGEQTPQPAVAAQLSTPSPSATIVADQTAIGPVAAAPRVAVTTGISPRTRSITAIDPRPDVALPPSRGHGSAIVFGGANGSMRTSNRQHITTSGFVPSPNNNALASGAEINTLPNQGGRPVLHHLKSILAIIGIVALLDRMRKQ